MTLEPGDVVLTGTPSGVGPVFPGDEVEVEVEGIGRNLAVTIGPKRE
jgi:2-keto-4-pentenoate hydratase/2-oxohepta-3-ene-1,7-dioic acid hydratase in catechol pathway